MSPDLLFRIFNNAVMPMWLLLALAPRWWLTQRLIHTPVFPLLMAAAYSSLLLLGLLTSTNSDPNGSFFSLDGVAALFSHKEILLIGWIHYLSFDLFVGCWVVRDSQQRNIRHYWIIPCLFLTLMFGPMGLLLYWIIRSLHPVPAND